MTGTTKKRDILHITIGDEENGWVPTPQDMHDITTMFMEASLSEDGAVIVTKQNVKCKVHTVEEGEHVRVVGAHVDAGLLEHLRTATAPVTVMASDEQHTIEVESQEQA